MKTRIEKITPKMADKYLEKNTSNRTISVETVAYYANQMRRGQWQLTGQGISFDTAGNLIDGQHRLSAIVESNISVEMLVITGISWDCFKTYDTGRRRSGGDTLSAAGIANSSSIAAGIKKYLILKKDNVANNSSVRAKISNTDILNEYYSDPDYWQDASNLAQNIYLKLRIIAKSDLLAYISYLCFEKNYDFDIIIDFFKMIVGLIPETNTSISLYRSAILNSIMTKNKLTTKYKHAILVKAWNNYIVGKQVKFLKYVESQEGYPQFLLNLKLN